MPPGASAEKVLPIGAERFAASANEPACGRQDLVARVARVTLDDDRFAAAVAAERVDRADDEPDRPDDHQDQADRLKVDRVPFVVDGVPQDRADGDAGKVRCPWSWRRLYPRRRLRITVWTRIRAARAQDEHLAGRRLERPGDVGGREAVRAAGPRRQDDRIEALLLDQRARARGAPSGRARSASRPRRRHLAARCSISSSSESAPSHSIPSGASIASSFGMIAR